MADANDKTNDKVITARVPARIAEGVDRLALRDMTSRGSVVRRALDFYLASVFPNGNGGKADA